MLPSLPLHPLHLHFYPCSSHLLTPSLLHITHQVPDRNSVVVPPRLTLRSSLQTLMQTTSPFCHAHLTTWVVLAFSFTASSAFGPASHLSYTLPPKPLWNSPNDFPHSPAFFAFQRSFHAPHSLLPFASRQWRSQTKKKPHRFGSSRSTTSPSQWAIQCLALNTSLALSAHLSSALHTNTPSHPPPPRLPGPSYTSPYTTSPQPPS